MTLVKWNPWKNRVLTDIERIDRHMNSWLNDLWSGEEFDRTLQDWNPSVDVLENDDAYVFSAELPGLKKEDVKITLKENLLTISGEKKFEKEQKDKNYFRMERNYGKFNRSFSLPTNVRAGDISADFSDGVLKITLPKAEEAKPKEISIK